MANRALVLFVALAACSANDTGSGSSCDQPPAAGEAIQLRDVLYVAADSRSTLYVLEQPSANDHRFFVSSGAELVRRAILGVGVTEGSGRLIMITFEDGAIPSTFYAQQQAEGEIVLALLRNEELRDKQSIPADAEILAQRDPALIASMKPVDLPSTRTIEYVASRQDGDRLYVDRPTHDPAYEDFRLFYGAMSAMGQRRVTNVTRFKDGGSTYVDFELDGKQAYVLFCTPFLRDPPYLLSIDGVEERLTRLDPRDSSVGEMKLACHDFGSSFEPPIRHSATVEATCTE